MEKKKGERRVVIEPHASGFDENIRNLNATGFNARGPTRSGIGHPDITKHRIRSGFHEINLDRNIVQGSGFTEGSGSPIKASGLVRPERKRARK